MISSNEIRQVKLGLSKLSRAELIEVLEYNGHNPIILMLNEDQLLGWALCAYTNDELDLTDSAAAKLERQA